MKFLTVLALIFITLRLIGVITWSWWLVLLPLYGGAAIVLGLIVLAILGGTTHGIVKRLLRNK